MNKLYNLTQYKEHLNHRSERQFIMLGFSDGTKDAGYIKANWDIYTTKEVLSRVSDENDIKVIFFDGRGEYLHVVVVKHTSFMRHKEKVLPITR